MAQPRFLLVVGRRVGGRSVPPWPGHSRRPASEAPPRRWFAWRLVGANSWELARSARVFANAAECERSVVELTEGISRCAAVLAHGVTPDSWSWELRLDGRVVAVAARLYALERECDYSLRAFLNAVRVVGPTLLVPKARTLVEPADGVTP